MLILQTKIHPPKTAVHALRRQRLFDQLTNGLKQDHRLLLVAAPAGFGKTTLVTTWLRTIQDGASSPHIAWLALDTADSEPVRFLRYMIAALMAAAVPLPAYLDEQLQGSEPPPTEIVLIELINMLASLNERVILLLEDYHVIHSQEIDDAIAYLLTHAPPTLHLAIVSRVEPNLPLSRLRARRHGGLCRIAAAGP